MPVPLPPPLRSSSRQHARFRSDARWPAAFRGILSLFEPQFDGKRYRLIYLWELQILGGTCFSIPQ